jgi:hypothetical protein
MKVLVIMIVRRLHRVGELLAVLEEPTSQMRMVRQVLCEEGRFPARRTLKRPLKALPAPRFASRSVAPGASSLVGLLGPWQKTGRALALESTPLRAKGGVWHKKKDKEAGRVAHSSIDTEAGWSKSGWPGWVYGWKL